MGLALLPNRSDALLFAKVGCIAMTIHRRFVGCLIGSVLLSGWMLPASAAELQVPALHRAVTVAAVKKPARRPLIRIASIEALPSSGSELRYLMLALGIGY